MSRGSAFTNTRFFRCYPSARIRSRPQGTGNGRFERFDLIASRRGGRCARLAHAHGERDRVVLATKGEALQCPCQVVGRAGRRRLALASHRIRVSQCRRSPRQQLRNLCCDEQPGADDALPARYARAGPQPAACARRPHQRCHAASARPGLLAPSSRALRGAFLHAAERVRPGKCGGGRAQRDAPSMLRRAHAAAQPRRQLRSLAAWGLHWGGSNASLGRSGGGSGGGGASRKLLAYQPVGRLVVCAQREARFLRCESAAAACRRHDDPAPPPAARAAAAA